MSVATPPLPRLCHRDPSSSITTSRLQSRPPQSKISAPIVEMSSSSSSSSSMAPPSHTSFAPRPSGITNGSTSTVAAAPIPISGKDTSSSAGKVFARPSKEWVLPERAKPGRKASTDEPENRRQSQNRLSQRAHRARRTDYIQTLEERLRAYEADEIHSNVRLQEVARALKADNERMKNEIGQLRIALSTASAEQAAWNAERHAMNDSIRALRTQVDTLRASAGTSPAVYNDSRPEFDGASMRSSPTLIALHNKPLFVSSRSAPHSTTLVSCPICPDPDPDCPCQRTPNTTANMHEPTLAGPPRCGLCDLSADQCLCRVSDGEEMEVKPTIPRSPSLEDESTGCGLCTSSSFCACRAAASESVMPPTLSVTVAAPAMPLRLRSRPTNRQSVWALDNIPNQTSRPEATCTGDPSNCDACRNDSFGREFCGHLFGKPQQDCAGCSTGNCMSISSLVHESPAGKASSATQSPLSPSPQAPLVLACCGAPELCGHAGGCAGEVIGLNGAPSIDAEEPETMRCDEAWKALKAHPNSKFAPLAILADVVARRSKCQGPRVELSPPPSSPAPAPQSVALTGMGMTAAEAAVEKRRIAVETSAVRDALRLLDGTTPAPSSTPLDSRTGDEHDTKRRRL